MEREDIDDEEDLFEAIDKRAYSLSLSARRFSVLSRLFSSKFNLFAKRLSDLRCLTGNDNVSNRDLQFNIYCCFILSDSRFHYLFLQQFEKSFVLDI